MTREQKGRLAAERAESARIAEERLKRLTLQIYPHTKSVEKTAQELGVSARTLHRLLARNPELKRQAQAGRGLSVNGLPKRES